MAVFFLFLLRCSVCPANCFLPGSALAADTGAPALMSSARWCAGKVLLRASVWVSFFNHDQYPLRLGSLTHSLLFSCLHCARVLVKDSGSLRRRAFPRGWRAAWSPGETA